MKNLNHPMQPIIIDCDGVFRFAANVYVADLLDGKMFTFDGVKSDNIDHLHLMQLCGCPVEPILNHPAATQEFKNKVTAEIDKLMGDKNNLDKMRANIPGRFFNNE